MNTINMRKKLNTSIAILATAMAFTTQASAGNNDAANYKDGDRTHQAMDKAQQDKQKHTSKEMNDDRHLEPMIKNAWLKGKLETALLLNRHLNNFTINSEVRTGKATLQGTVESEIDKQLAEQVALSIDGITRVDNQLKIDAKGAKKNRQERDGGAERSLSQQIDDLTTTATVKTKLLANGSTHGLSINVDTENSIVSLQGEVNSSEEKQLAEKIAENVDGVVEVNNELKITSTR